MPPNGRARDKRNLSIFITAPLYQRLKRRAEQLGMTVTEFLTNFIISETQNIELTKEDYEEIIEWISRRG